MNRAPARKNVGAARSRRAAIGNGLIVAWLCLFALGCGDNIGAGFTGTLAPEDFLGPEGVENPSREPAWERAPEGGYAVRIQADMYDEGAWEAAVRLNQDAYQPGDKIAVEADLQVDSPYLAENLTHIDGLVACLTAERLFDARGDPHSRVNINASTVLTVTGQPISSYHLGQPSHKLGKTYTGPVDEIAVVRVANLEKRGGRLRAHFSLSRTIDADFPAGYFRPEINFYVLQKDEVIPLALYPGFQKIVEQNLPIHLYDVLRQAFTVHHLPVVRVKDPAPPRMIWTLLAGDYSNGTLGVVAREDEGRFALSSNRAFQARFVAAMTDPAGAPITYRLEPGFPLLDDFCLPDVAGRSQERSLPTIPLNYRSGELAVTVIEPDGARVELGPTPFAAATPCGATTNDARFNYRFRKWGRHEIIMKGFIEDAWGHRYAGGGSYEVIVANRLTMDTTVKPGSPFLTGDDFGMTIIFNPPCRARVNVNLRYYPGSDPQRRKETSGAGVSDRFGYFTTGPLMKLDEPGEYLYEADAECADEQGMLWHGSQRSAGVVADANGDFVAHGLPWFPGAPDRETPARYHLRAEATAYRELSPFSRRNCLPQMTLYYPYHSGDVLHIGANDSYGGDAILPMLQAEDRRREFLPPAVSYPNPSIFAGLLNRPGATSPSVKKFADRLYIATILARVLRFADAPPDLPLLSRTSNGYYPFEYPEFIDRLAYFYSAAIRPGFVVRQLTAGNDSPNTYWTTSDTSMFQIGASGDQEDDLYRLTGGVVLLDRAGGRRRYGAYAAAAVVLPKGAQDNRVTAPLTEPLYAPGGTPYPLLIATAPGLTLEVGDSFGLGGTVFPPVESRAFGAIKFPNGETRTFEGQCNAIGKCRYPSSVFRLTEPGFYQVQQYVEAGGRRGGLTGAPDGTYPLFVLPAGAKPLLDLVQPSPTWLEPNTPYTVVARLARPLADARVHYILLTPGAILDQGELAPSGGVFRYRISLPDLQRQFHPLDLYRPTGPLATADVMELTLFLEARDDARRPVFAARKIVIRSSMVFASEPPE